MIRRLRQLRHRGGSVQTGDTAHVALWLVLAGMSVIAYVAVRRKRA